jgi:hypothetical protein
MAPLSAGSGRHCEEETTPGSSSSRPSKKRASSWRLRAQIGAAPLWFQRRVTSAAFSP